MHTQRMKVALLSTSKSKALANPRCSYCKLADEIEKAYIRPPHGAEEWSHVTWQDFILGPHQGAASIADLTGSHIWEYLANLESHDFQREQYLLQDDWCKVAKDFRSSVTTALRAIEHDETQEQTTK